jgi:coenzyme F420-reducing hydrogenase delta subunit
MPNPQTKHPTMAIGAIPSDIDNGVFLGNAVLDNVMSCVIAMGTELWATKRRMKVVEALLAKNGIPREAIESYIPSIEEAAAWEKDRDRFIELTLGSLGNDGLRDVGADFPKRG